MYSINIFIYLLHWRYVCGSVKGNLYSVDASGTAGKVIALVVLQERSSQYNDACGTAGKVITIQ